MFCVRVRFGDVMIEAEGLAKMPLEVSQLMNVLSRHVRMHKNEELIRTLAEKAATMFDDLPLRSVCLIMNSLVKCNVHETAFTPLAARAIFSEHTSILAQCNGIDLPLVVQFTTTFLEPDDNFWMRVQSTLRPLNLEPEGICCMLACLANHSHSDYVQDILESLAEDVPRKIGNFSPRQLVNATRDLQRTGCLHDIILDSLWRHTSVNIEKFPTRDLVGALVTMTKTQRSHEVPKEWFQSAVQKIDKLTDLDLCELMHATVQFLVVKPKMSMKTLLSDWDEIFTKRVQSKHFNLPTDLAARVLADFAVLCTVCKPSCEFIVPSYRSLVDYLLPSRSLSLNLNRKEISFIVQAVSGMQPFAELPDEKITHVEQLFLSLLRKQDNVPLAYVVDGFAAFVKLQKTSPNFWSVIENCDAVAFEVPEMMRMVQALTNLLEYEELSDDQRSCGRHWCQLLADKIAPPTDKSLFTASDSSAHVDDKNCKARVMVDLLSACSGFGVRPTHLLSEITELLADQEYRNELVDDEDNDNVSFLQIKTVINCWRSFSLIGEIDDTWLGLCWPALEQALTTAYLDPEKIAEMKREIEDLEVTDDMVNKRQENMVGRCLQVVAALVRSQDRLLSDHSQKFVLLSKIMTPAISDLQLKQVADIIHWVSQAPYRDSHLLTKCTVALKKGDLFPVPVVKLARCCYGLARTGILEKETNAFLSILSELRKQPTEVRQMPLPALTNLTLAIAMADTNPRKNGLSSQVLEKCLNILQNENCTGVHFQVALCSGIQNFHLKEKAPELNLIAKSLETTFMAKEINVNFSQEEVSMWKMLEKKGYIPTSIHVWPFTLSTVLEDKKSELSALRRFRERLLKSMGWKVITLDLEADMGKEELDQLLDKALKKCK